MRKFLGLIAAVLLVGCAAFEPRVIQIAEPYDEAQAIKQMQKGNNTIKGQAFLRQRGGQVVTCAGSSVALIPATAYAANRLNGMYMHNIGSQTVFAPPIRASEIVIVPDIAGYKQNIKTTQCDATGNFSFENVADGDFFVQANVVWGGGRLGIMGGHLIQKVKVEKGRTENLIMSQ